MIRQRIRGAILLGWLLIAPVHGQSIDTVKEAQVKAGYVLNFLRYSEFPPGTDRQADAPYRIVVLGDPRLAAALKSATEERIAIGARSLEVVSRADAPLEAAEVRAADLVFIGRKRSADVRAVLDALAGRPVLNVSDAGGFVRAGGMIGLRMEGARIVFDANPDAIRAGGLMLSARVLKLARELQTQDPAAAVVEPRP